MVLGALNTATGARIVTNNARGVAPTKPPSIYSSFGVNSTQGIGNPLVPPVAPVVPLPPEDLYYPYMAGRLQRDSVFHPHDVH